MVASIRASLRRILSFVLAMLQLYFAVLYAIPTLSTPSGSTLANPASTIKVVQFIQSLGPIFTLAFAVSGGVLFATLLLRRLIYVGHVLCFGVFLTYMTSLFLGALSSHPHGTIIAPSLCLFPVLGHGVLSFVYGGERP